MVLRRQTCRSRRDIVASMRRSIRLGGFLPRRKIRITSLSMIMIMIITFMTMTRFMDMGKDKDM